MSNDAPIDASGDSIESNVKPDFASKEHIETCPHCNRYHNPNKYPFKQIEEVMPVEPEDFSETNPTDHRCEDQPE